MALNPITTDLWEAVDQLRMPGGARLPVRMTVVRLPGGRLVLHSPIAIDDALAAELARLGEVAQLIAPSRLHDRWIDGAAARYPAAAVWDARRGEPVPAALAEHLDHVTIAGAPKVDETVFFHRASRSILCADFLFHITDPPNWQLRLVLRLMGTHGGRLAVSRLWNRYTRDRAAAKASVEAIRRWDAARIVVAHGAVFEGDVAAALDAASLDRITG